MHGDDIEVSLDKDATVLLHYGLLGEVEAIEVVALVVYLTLGRVYIFGSFGIVLQYTSTECNDLARYGMYREYYTSPETVLQAAVVGAVADACLGDEFGVVSCCHSLFGKTVAALKRVAQAELLDCLVAQASVAEIVQADSLSFLAFMQSVDKVLQCILVDDEEAFAYALLAFLLVGHFAFLYLYMIFLGQPPQCVGVAELFMLHNEVYGLASFAASEAFP